MRTVPELSFANLSFPTVPQLSPVKLPATVSVPMLPSSPLSATFSKDFVAPRICEAAKGHVAEIGQFVHGMGIVKTMPLGGMGVKDLSLLGFVAEQSGSECDRHGYPPFLRRNDEREKNVEFHLDKIGKIVIIRTIGKHGKIKKIGKIHKSYRFCRC